MVDQLPLVPRAVLGDPPPHLPPRPLAAVDLAAAGDQLGGELADPAGRAVQKHHHLVERHGLKATSGPRRRAVAPLGSGATPPPTRAPILGGMRRRLNAAQVAELAELLDDAPERVGVIDQVLQAAAEGRGMTLVLADPPTSRRAAAGSISRRAATSESDAGARGR